MTRAEREEFLRHYLEGEMNLEQEHDFLIQAALDKELRHELKAQQTIDRAFQKDRVVDPSAYASLQASVAGMIAAPVAAPRPASAEAGSLIGRFFSKGGGRWMFGGMLGVALLGGILLFGVPDDKETVTSTPQKSVSSSVEQPTMNAIKNSSSTSSTLQGDTHTQADQAGIEAATPTSIFPLSSSASARSASNTSQRNIPSRSAVLTPANTDLENAKSAAVVQSPAVHTPIDSAATPVHAEMDDSIGIGVRLQWKR